MDLIITNYNNFFALKGALHKNNVYQFQKEFKAAFRKFKHITVSVEGLERIDTYGINAMAAIHKESIKHNFSLAIVGYGCKALYDHFKTNEAA